LWADLANCYGIQKLEINVVVGTVRLPLIEEW
jgi:hypothetical protein